MVTCYDYDFDLVPCHNTLTVAVIKHFPVVIKEPFQTRAIQVINTVNLNIFA